MDLANRDQALKLEWEKLVNERAGSCSLEELVIEYGRRVLALAESKEELAKALDDGLDALIRSARSDR